VDELNLAGVKITELQDLIDKEQNKKYEHFKVLPSTWGSVTNYFVRVINDLLLMLLLSLLSPMWVLVMGQVDPQGVYTSYQGAVLCNY
jgi:hypothetical protein